MTQGYLTFVQNSGTTDYLEMAYAQALSIKTTCNINQYAVVVDSYTGSLITDRHRRVFDFVIPIPGVDESANDVWKLRNEWKALAATPFDETVKLEADMLFTSNIDHWWDIMSRRDVCFTTTIVDYTGKPSANRSYRQVFDDNNLLNVYNGFYYFKQSNAAAELFCYAQLIYSNWPLFRDQILKNCREKDPNTDLVFAVAIELIGREHYYDPVMLVPRFAHMKGAINGWGIDSDWRDHVVFQFDNTTLTVGFTRQQVPFHYYQKNFITSEIIENYESSLFQTSDTSI
jgi:hypothetical protein